MATQRDTLKRNTFMYERRQLDDRHLYAVPIAQIRTEVDRFAGRE
jgi:hypothetical protein